MEQPKFDPKKVPLPITEKHPLRCAIQGVTDKIDDLRTYIDSLGDIDPDLKRYISTELDELDSNAAEIHLHNVEHPGGGFNLHLSIRPRHLGAPKKVD